MLAKQTTFVLGAGASFELGLPTGDGLQEKIVDVLGSDRGKRHFTNDLIHQAVVPVVNAAGQGWPDRFERLIEAAERIRFGMPVAASIDNFLHTHRGDDDVIMMGKLAIAAAILKAEGSSLLDRRAVRRNQQVTLDPFLNEEYRASWYYPFMKMLTMGTASDDPHAIFTNLRFIVFNYDRCLELILLRSLTRYYGLSPKNAADILSTVEIIHPYGSIGKLTGVENVGFGKEDVDLALVAGGLKTFTEVVDSEIADQVKSAVAHADTLVFMGFGFLPQNMALLTPTAPRAQRLHATTRGFSASDTDVIAQRLLPFLEPTMQFERVDYAARGSANSGFVDLENQSCVELIKNHRMRLTDG